MTPKVPLALAAALLGCARQPTPADGAAPAATDAQAPRADATGGADSPPSPGPDAAAPEGGAADCGGCLALEQCWGGRVCVARSVMVPAGFTIDATEVTRGQYQAWLATAPATAGQSAACAWNTSFAPDAACMARPSVCQGDGCAEHPQPCVDLCDASAYCQAVGKRLCGAIGGGPLPYGGVSRAGSGQWYTACSSNGANWITYGATPAPGNCHDFLTFTTTTVPVGSKPRCQSTVPGYTGIFDLIGNLAEWEDNCLEPTGPDDTCKVRGLSFGVGAAQPHCGQEVYANRGEAADTIGFRCCGP